MKKTTLAVAVLVVLGASQNVFAEVIDTSKPLTSAQKAELRVLLLDGKGACGPVKKKTGKRKIPAVLAPKPTSTCSAVPERIEVPVRVEVPVPGKPYPVNVPKPYPVEVPEVRNWSVFAGVLGGGTSSKGQVTAEINTPAFDFNGSSPLSFDGGSVGVMAALDRSLPSLEWKGVTPTLGAEVLYLFGSGSANANGIVFPGSAADNALHAKWGNSIIFDATLGVKYQGFTAKALIGVNNTELTLADGWNKNITGLNTGFDFGYTFKNGVDVGLRYMVTPNFGCSNLNNGLLHNQLCIDDQQLVGGRLGYLF